MVVTFNAIGSIRTRIQAYDVIKKELYMKIKKIWREINNNDRRYMNTG
jgi:hypothetical protein